MMKTAMQQLADKTEKAILYATPDEANLLRGVLAEIKSLLPIEQEHLKYMHKQGYGEGYNDGRHDGEHVNY